MDNSSIDLKKLSNSNHYFFSYPGNKRKEVLHLIAKFESLKNFDEIDTIIEPFCGTSAFSYYLNLKYPNKYKFILNDTSHIINGINTFVKSASEEDLNNFEGEIYDAITLVKDDKALYNSYVKNTKIFKWELVGRLYYALHFGLFPNDTIGESKFYIFKDKRNYIDFLKSDNVKLTNIDGIQYLSLSEENELNANNVFMYLDPPYILTDNTEYKQEINTQNFYQFCYEKQNYLKSEIYFKPTFFLNIIKNWLVDAVFNKFTKIDCYSIQYAKRSSMKIGANPINQHYILCNK